MSKKITRNPQKFSDEVKCIAMRVLKKTEESEKKSLSIDCNKPIKRTSYYCGISTRTLYRWQQDEKLRYKSCCTKKKGKLN